MISDKRFTLEQIKLGLRKINTTAANLELTLKHVFAARKIQPNVFVSNRNYVLPTVYPFGTYLIDIMFATIYDGISTVADTQLLCGFEDSTDDDSGAVLQEYLPGFVARLTPLRSWRRCRRVWV
jgi:hypothetical protein